MADKAAPAPVDQLRQKFKIVRNGRGHKVEIAPGTDASTIGAPLLAKIVVNELVQKILSEPVRFPGGELTFAEAVALFSDKYEQDQKFAPVLGADCGKCVPYPTTVGTKRFSHISIDGL